jgi:membrane protein
MPQPERFEPRLSDPSAADLSRRDYVAILKRAFRQARDNNLTDAAAALAYYAFTALPATLLASLGIFSLLAGQSAVAAVTIRLARVAPREAVDLIDSSLTRVVQNERGGIAMIVVGAALALWAATGAMTALMRGLNVAYGRRETRGFLAKRLTALAMLALAAVAFLLTLGLVVLGPYLSIWVEHASGLGRAVQLAWWAGQWPVLVAGLCLVFGGILYVGPDVDHPRRRFLTLGASFAVVAWLVSSGLFALYVSRFGSDDETWGSLATVIVTLTWFWVSGLVLLAGAEIDAEAERSRELRQGMPAERRILAPARG